ncbi:unnamed protein product [Discosporangium mesarthrocarpum]
MDTTSSTPIRCLLFDMDGVLAEVSRSYRQAIVDTADHWNVPVSAADIQAAKVKGNSNNDWKLTHSLIKAEHLKNGVKETPDLQMVTDRFEELYQGKGGGAGLKDLEELIACKGEAPLVRMEVSLHMQG